MSCMAQRGAVRGAGLPCSRRQPFLWYGSFGWRVWRLARRAPGLAGSASLLGVHAGVHACAWRRSLGHAAALTSSRGLNTRGVMVVAPKCPKHGGDGAIADSKTRDAR